LGTGKEDLAQLVQTADEGGVEAMAADVEEAELATSVTEGSSDSLAIAATSDERAYFDDRQFQGTVLLCLAILLEAF
jgi:hypothetical protein